MINREFWEEIAEIWTRKVNIDIPDIGDIIDVPEDVLDLDNIENWEDMLGDIFESDSGESMTYEDILTKL
jgi:hypothetical protein